MLAELFSTLCAIGASATVAIALFNFAKGAFLQTLEEG